MYMVPLCFSPYYIVCVDEISSTLTCKVNVLLSSNLARSANLPEGLYILMTCENC